MKNSTDYYKMTSMSEAKVMKRLQNDQVINKAKPTDYASAGLFNDPDFNAILKMSGVKSILANRKDRKGNLIEKGGK